MSQNNMQNNITQGQQSLPPLSSLTNRLPTAEPTPAQPRQHSEAREVRDSGNWSLAQSKPGSVSMPALILTLDAAA
ncbi:hypothetical protein J4E85_009365 [Alternaria conjuncta]|uniref:uncharacterized protein n=1 Tax=Alternaria conjuncta TaxID=181017 RepID=UPI00221E5B0A|nr:uncharacterized protein J4E85_009365 [Alternaria conjuncta]KAI4920598.1 hypothetical protein J4E85_009365 [Alternaria conjuncta]